MQNKRKTNAQEKQNKWKKPNAKQNQNKSITNAISHHSILDQTGAISPWWRAQVVVLKQFRFAAGLKVGHKQFKKFHGFLIPIFAKNVREIRRHKYLYAEGGTLDF